MKLTLGQAAKHAGRAKGTLSKALNNGQISGEKDAKGRWQIDPSELQRWMEANPLQNADENQDATLSDTPQNPSGNSALEVEVKMLREQMAEIRSLNERERQGLLDQIEALREQAERQSADHRQALAALTDQRDRKRPRRGLWGRLMGS